MAFTRETAPVSAAGVGRGFHVPIRFPIADRKERRMRFIVDITPELREEIGQTNTLLKVLISVIGLGLIASLIFGRTPI